MSTEASNLDIAIWDRLIIADNDGRMSPRTARAILLMKFSERDHQRMERLAAKNRRGKLSAKERAEMEGYLRVGMTLAILWAKARKALKQARTVRQKSA